MLQGRDKISSVRALLDVCWRLDGRFLCPETKKKKKRDEKVNELMQRTAKTIMFAQKPPRVGGAQVPHLDEGERARDEVELL